MIFIIKLKEDNSEIYIIIKTRNYEAINTIHQIN